jgi:hypothetical protein
MTVDEYKSAQKSRLQGEWYGPIMDTINRINSMAPAETPNVGSAGTPNFAYGLQAPTLGVGGRGTAPSGAGRYSIQSVR